MEITAKAKSAIYHLNTAVPNLEKAQIHLMQAKANLRKDDTEGRDAVDMVAERMAAFVASIEEAVDIITTGNPSKAKEE